MDPAAKGWRVGVNWEIGSDIDTLPCVKQGAGGNLLYSTGAQLLPRWLPGGVGWGSGGRCKREGTSVYT